MRIAIHEDKLTASRAAARFGAEMIRNAIAQRGRAHIIVATGASQIDMLEALVESDVDWRAVHGFHLDEYIGLARNHPASFCQYLRERFVDRVPLAEFVYIDGQADPRQECQRLGETISNIEIDVAFIGIGENGHLAFNDPPADFATKSPYIVVDLDRACREQQVGEGWFASLDEVPKQAISMSVGRIMRSRSIVCTVPDERKSNAVKNTVEGPVTPDVPASILQQHEHATLFLDRAAASQLSPAS